ncbi:hypothetical protein SAMN05444266_102312 [Chitinophaga jiangningensis]|uniref:Uncharacterized protein n=1 Tax=Chitinophaga jiangningensis TaxID=1419482 RepID=A0A1M6YGQ8_9BACT|nr:hypothetical protein [Chitinophaga jiangningensis]SHL17494.1 hypothetical protein SAMN05444266_102312 [Chitinophaga jiangningensis]
MLNINKPKPGDSALYHLTSANRTIVGGRLMEFVQQKVVRMKMIGEEGEDTVFEYALLAQQVEGTALIHEWAMDMEILQSPLKIVLDANGQLKDVRNLYEIRERWESTYANQLRRKYKKQKEGLEELMAATSALLEDKSRFVQSLNGFSAWRFFFQDNFKGQATASQQSLLLKGFFGQVDLPLTLTADWEEEYGIGEYHCQLTHKGKLDKPRFDRKQFGRMLKDLTGVFNVSAELDLLMEEEFHYDKHRWLTAGEMYLETKVADWYQVASAHVLDRIDEDRALALKKNFNVAAEYTA